MSGVAGVQVRVPAAAFPDGAVPEIRLRDSTGDFLRLYDLHRAGKLTMVQRPVGAARRLRGQAFASVPRYSSVTFGSLIRSWPDPV